MVHRISTVMLFVVTICFVNAQDVPVPENYAIVTTVSGDLDKDGVNGLVVAHNTGPEKGSEGISRELIMYKLENDQWTVWKTSDQALYGSKDGGMMGDPLNEIKIKNGILSIIETGGSSWRWGDTDKYRFQNGEFYLIGHTSFSGRVCDFERTADFNLTTGKMIVEKVFEKCETEDQEIYKRESETFFKKGLEITIGKRREREIKITTPKYGYEIYIALKKE